MAPSIFASQQKFLTRAEASLLLLFLSSFAPGLPRTGLSPWVNKRRSVSHNAIPLGHSIDFNLQPLAIKSFNTGRPGIHPRQQDRHKNS